MNVLSSLSSASQWPSAILNMVKAHPIYTLAISILIIGLTYTSGQYFFSGKKITPKIPPNKMTSFEFMLNELKQRKNISEMKRGDFVFIAETIWQVSDFSEKYPEISDSDRSALNSIKGQLKGREEKARKTLQHAEQTFTNVLKTLSTSLSVQMKRDQNLINFELVLTDVVRILKAQ